MNFTLEQPYGVTRDEYCVKTGISKGELAAHLRAEITILRERYNRVRKVYRARGLSSTVHQMRRAELLRAIENKMQSKRDKIYDIEMGGR